MNPLLLFIWTMMMLTLSLPITGERQENHSNRHLGGRGIRMRKKGKKMRPKKRTGGAVTPSVACTNDIDCNLFINSCGDCGDLCSCLAVAANEEPCGANTCKGPVAKCSGDSCASKEAKCKLGKCLVVDI